MPSRPAQSKRCFTVVYRTPNGEGLFQPYWVTLAGARRWLYECTAKHPGCSARIISRTPDAARRGDHEIKSLADALHPPRLAPPVDNQFKKHSVAIDGPDGMFTFFRRQWVPIKVARQWLEEAQQKMPERNPRIVTRTGKAVAKPYVARPTKRKLVPRNPDYRLV